MSHTGDTPYLRGSAGSLVMACTSGCPDAFRDRITDERCQYCGVARQPVRLDEVESRWRPIWARAAVGHEFWYREADREPTPQRESSTT